MAKRQATLLSWSLPSKERRKGDNSAARSSDVEQNYSDSKLEGVRGSGLGERDESRLVDDEERGTGILEGEEETMSESTFGPSSSTSESPSNSTADSEPSRCSALCCITTNKVFQPTDKQTSSLS